MKVRKFKLSKEDIRPLATGYGACFATDMITVEGLQVRRLYRQAPDRPIDSGWRFLSGYESQEYLDDASNTAVYDVNTIANYDPSIIPLLDAPIGSEFEKPPDSNDFVEVKD